MIKATPRKTLAGTADFRNNDDGILAAIYLCDIHSLNMY